jgi:hypothetical protein
MKLRKSNPDSSNPFSNRQIAAGSSFPFRILRNFVPRKRIRSGEDIPEGIGEGYSNYYLLMKEPKVPNNKY